MKEVNRIKNLKALKKMANDFLSYYKKEQKARTVGWEKGLVERNIFLLKEVVTRINEFLHPKSVAEFLESRKPLNDADAGSEKVLFQSLNLSLKQWDFSLVMDIVKCSPRMSYFNDFTWFRHGTVKDHIDYALGKADESIFEPHLPYQIGKIEELQNSFFTKTLFRDDLILVESILLLLKEEKYIPANILSITLTEGLVRKFCFRVYQKHHPEKTAEEIDQAVYVGKSSFENLIKDVKWPREIPVKFSSFLTEYSHTHDPIVFDFEQKFSKHKKAINKVEKKYLELDAFCIEQVKGQTMTDSALRKYVNSILDEIKRETTNVMSTEDQTIMIGLDIYLDFLVKKFKEDRNHIIHGKYSFFKEKWRSLVYLSALETLIRKIIWYEENVAF
jgi:hypothetical protein